MESTQLLSPEEHRSSNGWMKKIVLTGCLALGSLGFLVLTQKNNSTTSLASLKGSSQVLPPVVVDIDFGDLPDPENMEPLVTMLALGDWGGTLGKEYGDPGSCCIIYNGWVNTRSYRFQIDYWAQQYVAELMALSAIELKPTRILSHGDNFYWVGVGMDNANYRFEQSFEKIYNQPSLQNIPWINVMGNHDIGGANFICGDSEPYWECSSSQELVDYLERRYQAQTTYKSPNGDRWILRDHYYTERVERNGVVVEIFNLDTNYAEGSGAKEVCCQCYGYAAKYNINPGVCSNIQPGNPSCAGGSLDMYNACMDRIDAWANESYTRAYADILASDADFTIVNTHYSPHYHMSAPKMQKWYDLCKATNLTVWINGHTHGFNHDIANWGTHFIENGGGGGYFTANSPIIENDQVKNQWLVVGQPYGIMELSFSKEWLKIQFATFDNNWQYGGLDYSKMKVGGIARGHCWFIPRTGSNASPRGIECNSSMNGAIGAPLYWS
ncbi:calcineurin-like phosphoesterase [Thraustotheca clavata]|uniref:Calcineurin-like phosphoesterase n=1 Tax=Thraustotheca clavata TaxID=74557 RepID=A0A1V9Y7G6_9STRA|nr:calcineurin-like phosphoesterase [Thraustotheca clavata]